MMDIYERYVNKYGVVPQLETTVEECAELIKAIQKYLRAWRRYELNRPQAQSTRVKIPSFVDVNPHEIVEEAIDVAIMLKQLRRVFPSKLLWEQIKGEKMERLERRLEGYE